MTASFTWDITVCGNEVLSVVDATTLTLSDKATAGASWTYSSAVQKAWYSVDTSNTALTHP